MKNVLKGFALVIALLVIVYLAGPKVEVGELNKDLPRVPDTLEEIESMIKSREASLPNIRNNNEAQLIWYDSVPSVTEYAMVYLHGFSASRIEGNPVHKELAKRYGCNLYLPRITGHGLNEEEAMLNLTAEDMIASAAEAIAIGKKIGKKVLLLTTSTGGTYGLYLAENQPDIAALVLYSPNIKIYDPNSFLLSKPWGLQLARFVKGSDYHQWPLDSVRGNYWTNKYRLEVLTQLQAMVENTMTPETFASVQQPVFLGYYYKNDTAQDNTVSVPAMLEMYDQLGTSEDKKRKFAFPEANHHVIGSYLTSGDIQGVEHETIKFLEEVVGLQPVNSDSVFVTY